MALYKHVSRLVATAAVLICSSAAHANLVVNGGFENGDFSNWTLTDTGDMNVWNAAQANAILVDQGGPFAGSFGAYLGPANLQFLSQSIATVVGQHYRLTYELANLPCQPNQCTNGGNAFQVFVGGLSVFSAANAPASAFTAYSDDFVATSTSTTLSFGATNYPGFFGLDAVSINAVSGASVPEPSDLALLTLGALSMGLAKRRRKTRGI